jgi:hypothetical protein
MAWQWAVCGLILLIAGFSAAQNGTDWLTAASGKHRALRAALAVSAPAALLFLAAATSAGAAEGAFPVVFGAVSCAAAFCIFGGGGEVLSSQPVSRRQRMRDALPCAAAMAWLIFRGRKALSGSHMPAALTPADGAVLLAAAAVQMLLLAATAAEGFPGIVRRRGRQPGLLALLAIGAGICAMAAGWLMLREGIYAVPSSGPVPAGTVCGTAAGLLFLPEEVRAVRKGRGTPWAVGKTCAALSFSVGTGFLAFCGETALSAGAVRALAACVFCVLLSLFLPAERKRAVRVCGAGKVAAGIAAVLFVFLHA